MIYVACGSLMIVVGLFWLVIPARKPNPLYGYFSFLARVNQASFKFAQKRASLYFMLFGLIQVLLGLLIHFLQWDRYFLVWLLTFYFFILFSIIWTEKSLQKFLRGRGELPHDYVEPDKVKHTRTKGFKD
ncbi:MULTISPECIES: SdpI family protein [Lactobacillus]|uniref:SdpI family protein n=1 Tax=Lactobacillus xujianguonis TaxID=2495899 RepID=A0A437SWE1_9LACO|nr:MULTISPECIES: SdpI family protein [Lactobacillus]RVU71246.1 SdpI family protein [Lactobacillus xujianguonis]RVU74099.1 SdpI family protein [Lactobacillus xujianguonis]